MSSKPHTPTIDPRLLDWLRWTYKAQLRLPELTTEDREIWRRVGIAEVVDKIALEIARQQQEAPPPIRARASKET